LANVIGGPSLESLVLAFQAVDEAKEAMRPWRSPSKK